ncbi:MAG TPA: hypothetical protein IAB72_04335 [Candidatus Onthoplasma faecipullorum]|nr:hypothetical protein [Candidatus Onthoplasma faecipullorum]
MKNTSKEEWTEFLEDEIKFPLVITNEWIDKKYNEWKNSENPDETDWEMIWRWGFCNKDMSKYDLSKLDKEHMAMLTFNSSTIWPSADKMPKDFNPQVILERGKNPMLGIRELHKQGITGKGIVVACMDSCLNNSHIEFSNANIHIKDEVKQEPNFHGEGVLSNLLGKNIGVAPDVECYYYAVHFWRGEKFIELYTRYLDDIINKIKSGIPIKALIRSGALYSRDVYEKYKDKNWCKEEIITAYGSIENFEKVLLKVDELERLGCVLVDSLKFELSFSCCEIKYYDDYNNPENYHYPDQFFPKNPTEKDIASIKSYKPATLVCGGKVVPEFCSDTGYKFEQVSCYSWTIPQAVGMYALCLQVYKDLTWNEFCDIAKSTSKMNKNYVFLANPKEIIKEVKILKENRAGVEV